MNQLIYLNPLKTEVVTMRSFNKDSINQMLEEERLQKPGESDSFVYDEWELSITKEEPKYSPFEYSVRGNHNNGSSWSRRYTSMEKAILHILNDFNENANILNRYDSLEDAFMRCNKI